jgi:hypothetical protein
MQVRDIMLAMRRAEKLDEEGMHKFTGYLDVVCEDKADNIRTDFPGAVTYRQAVTLLATAAQRHLGARLFLLRLDQRPQQVALQLDGALSKMVREDPVAFMRLMDPTMGRPQKLDISMSVRKEHSAAIKSNPLPAGYDTLAEAFGDEVYCRMKRGGATECPFCGRWGAWARTTVKGFNSDRVDCEHCKVTFYGQGIPTSRGGWFKIPVVQLFNCARDLGADRFFLPRAWNKDGPWISRADLQKKYDEFMKEKEECSRMHKADTSA